MDFRAELRERLQRVPFSAAQVAREAKLSRDWVAKARKGTAHKLGWDTAQRIHAAIDGLAEQARPREDAAPASPQHHPGVEALAEDVTMRARCNVTDGDIADLRSMILPATVHTKDAALVILAVLRPASDA